MSELFFLILVGSLLLLIFGLVALAASSDWLHDKLWEDRHGPF